MKTRMTELLGIEHPIMQGGMQNLGVPKLAAAVSEAGGLGTINVTIYPDLEDLRAAIRQVKAATKKPFEMCIRDRTGRGYESEQGGAGKWLI